MAELYPDDYLFDFGHRQALKFLSDITKRVKAKCVSTGTRPTWKDFRSSMAYYLLQNGWTTDEIKARLGHSPSSRVLDKYVNYLAVGRDRPKQKVSEGKMSQLLQQIDEMKQREKAALKRIEIQQSEFTELKRQITELTEGRGFIKLLQKVIGDGQSGISKFDSAN